MGIQLKWTFNITTYIYLNCLILFLTGLKFILYLIEGDYMKKVLIFLIPLFCGCGTIDSVYLGNEEAVIFVHPWSFNDGTVFCFYGWGDSFIFMNFTDQDLVACAMTDSQAMVVDTVPPSITTAPNVSAGEDHYMVISGFNALLDDSYDGIGNNFTISYYQVENNDADDDLVPDEIHYIYVDLKNAKVTTRSTGE